MKPDASFVDFARFLWLFGCYIHYTVYSVRCVVCRCVQTAMCKVVYKHIVIENGTHFVCTPYGGVVSVLQANAARECVGCTQRLWRSPLGVLLSLRRLEAESEGEKLSGHRGTALDEHEDIAAVRYDRGKCTVPSQT